MHEHQLVLGIRFDRARAIDQPVGERKYNHTGIRRLLASACPPSCHVRHALIRKTRSLQEREVR